MTRAQRNTTMCSSNQLMRLGARVAVASLASNTHAYGYIDVVVTVLLSTLPIALKTRQFCEEKALVESLWKQRIA